MSSRRRFVRTACGAVILSDLVVLGCSPTVNDIGDDDDDNLSSPVPTVTPNGNLVSVAIADYVALSVVEGSAIVHVAAINLYVIIVRVSASDFIALDAKCSHRNCYVSYQSSTDQFGCSCHGATFSQTGAVLGGPAPSPLAVFPATFDDVAGVVTVDITGA